MKIPDTNWKKKLTTIRNRFRGFDQDLRADSRLSLETLEPRMMLSTVTVSTALDTVDANDGETSLREALVIAENNSGEDTIVFASELTEERPIVIELVSELQIKSDVSIEGGGSVTVTSESNRLFHVFAGSTAQISGLEFENGSSNNGGQIYNRGDLTVSNSYLHGGIAAFHGGSIYHREGNLTIEGSTFEGNHAAQLGSSIVSHPHAESLHITNSTFSGNTSDDNFGTILFQTAGNSSITNSTITNNLGGGVRSLNSGLTINNSIVSKLC